MDLTKIPNQADAAEETLALFATFDALELQVKQGGMTPPRRPVRERDLLQSWQAAVRHSEALHSMLGVSAPATATVHAAPATEPPATPLEIEYAEARRQGPAALSLWIRQNGERLRVACMFGLPSAGKPAPAPAATSQDEARTKEVAAAAKATWDALHRQCPSL
jgi:hypothetical protein